MDCKKCMEQMSLHLDKAADGDEREFHQHLRSCAKCRILYERMASAREHLQSMPEAEVPQGFHETWMKAAKEAQAKAKKTNLKWVRIAAPIAAAFVVALVGWQLITNGIIRMGGSPNEAPAPMALKEAGDAVLQSAADERTAAATMAPGMTTDKALSVIPPSQESPAGIMATTAPTSGQTLFSYTISGKPEARQGLTDLLTQWGIEPVPEAEGMRISFTIGYENYDALMDWLSKMEAMPQSPPPTEKRDAANSWTMSFEITFN